MKKKNSYYLNFLIIAIVAIAVLYYSLGNDAEEILELLKAARIERIILCLIAILSYHGLVAVILKLFANLYNPKYTLKSAYLNALIAALFHGITPFASGGQFIQAYVFHKDDIDVGESSSILFMDFIVYQSTLVLVTFVLVAMNFNYFFKGSFSIYSLAFLGFLVNLVVILSLWIFARSYRAHRFLSEKLINFLGKLHLVKDVEVTTAKTNDYLDKFNVEVKHLANNPKIIVQVVLINIVRLVLYFSIPALCAFALGIELNAKMVIESIAIASFVSMVNAFIPLPGASGTESVFILLFNSLFGKGYATGVMLIWRVVTYYFILLVGTVAYYIFKRDNSIKEIEEEIYENRNV